MKKAILALDVQSGLRPSEVIVNTINRLADRLPTIATVLTPGPHTSSQEYWLSGWHVPENDNTLVRTEYVFTRHGYALPLIIQKLLEKNGIEEVFVTGAHTEAALLGAGTALFDMGIKPILVAPLCLTGQYHQHSVTMRIWENSLGPVYESVAEMGLGIS